METKEFNSLLKSISTEQSSVERLYCFYYPRIVRHVSLKFGIEELGNDVAQEFFVNLMRIGSNQDYINSPTGWVYAVADNIAKRRLYYENRYNRLPDGEEWQDSKPFDGELKEEIQEILQALDSVSKEIIRLYYWEGYNQNEIAKMLNLTPSNVRKKHSRALKKLRNLL